MAVLDGAIAVLDANAGVEPQTETVWRQADRYKVPRIVYVNKMDKIGADFFNCVRMIQDRTGAVPAPIQIPIGAENELEGLVDLITMQEWVWAGEDLGATWELRPIRESLQDTANEWRAKLIETAVEMDDDAMMAYLEGEEPDAATLRALIRKGTLEIKFIPILCGSAFKNKGVQPLLNAVIDYLPSPLDVADYMGFRPGDETETRDIARRADDDMPFSALAFKIMNDPFVGTLTFTRIYSGMMNKGDGIFNSTKGKKERVGRMMMMHSNNREEIEEAFAGDIIALAGLKDTTTGDTLCDVKEPVILETMTFPDPVIEIAVEPKTNADIDKLGLSLAKLAEDDPTFQVKTDEASGQTVISGMGELHLDIIIDRLRREFKVEVNQGQPQVEYKEALTALADHREVYKKQTGGRGKFADIVFTLEPAEEGKVGLGFINEIKGGNIPKEYIPCGEKGFKDSMKNGPLAGFEVDAMKVTLKDGSFHPVDSDSLSFELAAKIGFKESAKAARAVIMEPIMKLEVLTPEENMGDIVGDLNRRRGQVNSMDDRAGSKVVKAEVPLSEMFGYVTALRTLSSGRATSTMEFDHYAETPTNISEGVIAEIKGNNS